MTWVTNYYHFDGLGSTVQITGQAAEEKGGFSYDAFGNLRVGNSLATSFLYVGREGYFFDTLTDDSYLRARNYDAKRAWLSADPEFELSYPNLYCYVDNNPLNVIDPAGTGVFTKSWWCCEVWDKGATEPKWYKAWGQGLIYNKRTICAKGEKSDAIIFAHEDINEDEECPPCKVRGTPDLFYVRFARISAETRAARPDAATADSCGAYHTDIFTAKRGEVRGGGFGGVGGVATPKWPSEYDTPLKRSFNKHKKLEHGSGEGKTCCEASYEEILDCVQKKDAPKGGLGATTNCQTDCEDAAKECCLSGFKGLSCRDIPVIEPMY